jgi:predicted mannosyl-3-phosphoglycerate phosphatase (HAD superfamily)
MNYSTLQKIVFSDIDGTLIDIRNGKFEGTDLLVKKLAKMGIPVILCSAKTRDEQEYIRNKLELSDPFIIENGGAVVIPDGYFDEFEIAPHTRKNGYHLIEIGGHSSEKSNGGVGRVRAPALAYRSSLSAPNGWCGH